MIYKIGTRSSPLALKQVDEVLEFLREFYPDIRTEIVCIETYGDKDKITPISDIEGTDFFTREIDEALLRKEIDFAVHSAKDLPDKIVSGLCIAAITKSLDPYDALVSKNNLKLKELPIDAKIGASSQRRKEQLKAYRRDFRIIDIRGNIEERLAILENLGLDAIIVAACALTRLGLEQKITERIPFDILKPHPLQGALAIEIREDDRELLKMFRSLISLGLFGPFIVKGKDEYEDRKL
jgi:hydroxymethylbilane synthase